MPEFSTPDYIHPDHVPASIRAVCTWCGALVIDQVRHTYFHEILDRRSRGWESFGWHAGDSPVPTLDFDGLDEDGLPRWERVRAERDAEAALTSELSDADTEPPSSYYRYTLDTDPWHHPRAWCCPTCSAFVHEPETHTKSHEPPTWGGGASYA